MCLQKLTIHKWCDTLFLFFWQVAGDKRTADGHLIQGKVSNAMFHFTKGMKNELAKWYNVFYCCRVKKKLVTGMGKSLKMFYSAGLASIPSPLYINNSYLPISQSVCHLFCFAGRGSACNIALREMGGRSPFQRLLKNSLVFFSWVFASLCWCHFASSWF